jgi:hypothetical protein
MGLRLGDVLAIVGAAKGQVIAAFKDKTLACRQSQRRVPGTLKGTHAVGNALDSLLCISAP